MIAIVDYDVGNLSAVSNMLRRLGIRSEITYKEDTIQAADRIILPGNGSFDECMRNLAETGLIPTLVSKVLIDKTPFLGICVGAQILGNGSDEGRLPGLGWLSMRARRFSVMDNLKIPHMGWENVEPNELNPHRIVGHNCSPRYYFTHSYFLDPASQSDVLFWASYGIRFAAAVAKENIIGVQFHPEKSHKYGKEFLNYFASYTT